MPLSDEQAQLVREVSDPNGTVAAALPVIWGLYATKADIDPQLQRLYSKRACLDVRLGEEQPNTTFGVQADITDQQSDRFGHLQQMRADVQAEIVRWEAVVSSTQGPAAGCISATELSRAPVAGQPDAAAPAYRGSPYYRPRKPS